MTTLSGSREGPVAAELKATTVLCSVLLLVSCSSIKRSCSPSAMGCCKGRCDVLPLILWLLNEVVCGVNDGLTKFSGEVSSVETEDKMVADSFGQHVEISVVITWRPPELI